MSVIAVGPRKPGPRKLGRPQWAHRLPLVPLVLGLVAALLVGYIVSTLAVGKTDVGPDTPMPQSAALEAATGVRFSRVAVVGDGGLVMVEYVVLDVEKAVAFQADRAHVPTLVSEAREGGTQRVSIMKPGHLIRAGQTYYFVYQNTASAIRPGEMITLRYLSHELPHVPVV